MGGACSAYGGRRGIYRVLMDKPEGKRPLRRHRHRWEDNSKMNLQKWDVGVWTGSSWLRMGTGNKLSGSIKCGEFLDWLKTS